MIVGDCSQNRSWSRSTTAWRLRLEVGTFTIKANTESWERGNQRGLKALVSEYRRIKLRPDEVSRLWAELILVWSIGKGKENQVD